MKAVLQNMKTGELAVDDVPPPALRSGGILVAVRRSLISLGTERAILAMAKKGPLGKARDRPDLARKVIQKARHEGWWNTYQVVKNLLASPIALGYSTAGVVTAVHSSVSEFQVGDRVACAGLECAQHSEINAIPRNLAAKMPEGVDFDAACFVTVGAIALQGVRLGEFGLGDRVVVLGLGLVGQIAAQLARCGGATVLAYDPDAVKAALAERLGAHAVATDTDVLRRLVREMTGGAGADRVLVCAATKSSTPLALAASVSRLKGRVVLVGDVALNLERRPWFERELELVVSRSYGPGRYDPSYEEHGRDYPLPYVRWTEGRNMESFLEFLARGDVDVASLVTHRFPIEDATSAYEIVTGKRREPAVAILLEYGAEAPTAVRSEVGPRRDKSRDRLELGVIGAGQFAKGVLLPAFHRQPVAFRGVCTVSGHSSKVVAKRYGAVFCTSDPNEVLADEDTDAVIIATRHDHHASLVASALAAQKAVFVEKPLALSEDELQLVLDVAGESPRLLVGFNRRFAPPAVALREFLDAGGGARHIHYRVNAGPVPPESWVLDPAVGGGRILGEVCHFIDFITYVGGALPVRVFAEAVGPATGPESPGISVTVRLANGAVGVVHYLTAGDTSLPKERCEVSAGGRSAVLDNFRVLELHQNGRRRRRRWWQQAKGHREEAAAFVKALLEGADMPIDWPTLVAVTRATLLVPKSLSAACPLDVLGFSASGGT